MNFKFLNLFKIFIFFKILKGFETSSSTLSFCLFELARHPEILKKLHDEIDEVLSTSPEGFTYENLWQMKYLDCCINETLRLYPVVPFMFRTVTKDYEIPDSNLVIPKGHSVFIPTLGHHRDPEIYDNPSEFRPERFLNSSTGSSSPIEGLFYLPFGDGPRNCIGMRLGLLTVKLGLVKALSKFNFELSDKTMAHGDLEFNTTQFVLAPIKPLEFKLTPRARD